MDYRKACEYLREERKKKGMVLGLEAMRHLMAVLGNPQDRLRFIHIAGTNGKGSVAAYLEQTLICAGYSTGKYTSPSVFDFREQYQVNGSWITEEEAASCMTRIAAAAARLEEEGLARPTYFEQETALAFVWFAEKGCSLVVLETGLGGDEDATNIVNTTVCSVLTSISMDHRRILGETLGEIAGHKAGIIKTGVPVVSHPQAGGAMEVIERRCRKMDAPLTVSRPEYMRLTEETEEGMTVSYGKWERIHTAQRAVWQMDNMAVALEAAGVLQGLGYAVSDRAVREGFARMRWRGRFEVMEGRPMMILDGAHNPDGAAALRRSLDHSFPDGCRVFVMGVLADKDYRSMIRILLEGEQTVFTVASDSPRALPAGELEKEIREQFPGIQVQAAGSVRAALELAQTAAGEEGRIIVCGSLSFMKEIDSWRKGRYRDGSGEN